MMLRFSKKAVWSKQTLFKFQNTQIMSNVFVMPICPHHRQYPGSVWAVKQYCFGIGINLDNNCYSCLAWQKTIWQDVSWVWLGQIGIGVKMICWAKTSYKTVTNTKNRSGDDDSFFQEKRLTYVSTFQISKRTKNAWAWGVMFPFSKKVVCST